MAFDCLTQFYIASISFTFYPLFFSPPILFTLLGTNATVRTRLPHLPFTHLPFTSPTFHLTYLSPLFDDNSKTYHRPLYWGPPLYLVAVPQILPIRGRVS